MCPTPDGTLVDASPTFADLQRQLAESRAERDEALAREAASAEVLQVINSSPGDLAPVFDAMLEKAVRLCEANTGHLFRFENGAFFRLASHGVPEDFDELFPPNTPVSVIPGSIPARMLATRAIVHVRDQREDETYRLAVSDVVAAVEAGILTVLFAPLIKEGEVVGHFTMHRLEVKPFSDKQIALLQNFAAQAVIAMENARLITETREALEQQTATAEVLGVINSSPGDLAPVFEAMLEKASRLCEAETGHLSRYENGLWFREASLGVPEEFDRLFPRGQPLSHVMTPASPPNRMTATRTIIHVADMREDESYLTGAPAEVAGVQAGIRTALFVPLLKEGDVVGCFVMHRMEVRAFTDKQISLLQNFAAQAVIAMENARLITETREALKQQTATSEVLGVINSSPGDLTPVFEAMLEKAHSLCAITYGSLQLYDGEKFRAVAVHNLPKALADQLRQGYSPNPNLPNWRLLEGAPFAQVADMGEIDDPIARRVVESGIRTLLYVALRKDDVLLGQIVAGRQEVRPFSDKEIALLQNFAAQAVIAMENARLITETREALDQQTATAEVLQVINSSPGDLAPVFDAMLEKAMHLCEAAFGGLWTFEGERYVAVALRGVPAAYAEFLANTELAPPGPGTAPYRFQHGERSVIQNVDLADEEPYRAGEPNRRALVDLGVARTALQVPLCKDDAVLGVITIYRQEVRPFTDKQIALLQNFAAQAVIAMENARLITETREALEQQTATSDVLKVISQSTSDLEPVLQTVLDTAMRLCGNSQGSIFRLGEDGLYRQAVGSGMQPEYYEIEAQQEVRPGSATLVGRTAIAARPVQITDAWADPDYAPKEDARVGQLRSMLGVPLLREGTPIGVICTARTIVKPFTEKEIELVATFADQAVIAIENARLLGELRQREAELRVTFDNMADGVAMFDSALHLAAWNRNFQELLQLPDDFLAERLGFDDYIRYLTERGEFGETDPEAEIARLRGRLQDHYSFERSRPDGAVIEVRHNPMPDGGVVLIYSDITERKRSEVEIRAARDTAEATLRDLKAAQANLIQAEKMASLGQLTAGIAHEIKNPLNFVNNFASLSVELLDELKETTAPALAALDQQKRAEADDTMEMLTGNLEKIAEHGKRADNIVKSMLEHSRGVSGERRRVDLNGVIEEALNLAYHGARAQDQNFNITLERDYASTLKPIELAPQEITRVFLNLFGNGFYAATKRARENGDGSFRPSLSVTTREDGSAVEVRVRDNGTGIPPEIKDKLFQPFFTTKPTGEGTGLGLSISYDIVTQQHGGTITVASEPGVFTEFTIRLPRGAAADRAGAAR
jgi:GAF domain-containing protein/nitrogen-specific signal transduction histidine kinase